MSEPQTATDRHGQWLLWCAERLTVPALEWIVGSGIKVQKFPWNRGLLSNANIQAGIVVSLGSKTNSDTDLSGIRGTNRHKVVGYGAQITIIRPSNQDLAFDPRWTKLREDAEAVFSPAAQPAAPGLPWVETIVIEEATTIDPAAFQNQYDVQAFVARAIGRELRGRL